MNARAPIAGSGPGVRHVPGVAILLSTHNGSAYLGRQIESLQDQTYAGWTLWVRDDGSTDGTLGILERLRKDDARIHVCAEGTRRGACASFACLLSDVSADYLMFCDQDDVWRPQKVETMRATIREHESRLGAGTPILLHSDLRLMTRDGRPAGRSFMRAQGIRHVEVDPLPVLIVQNFVTGCATIFNRSLRNAALPVPPEAVMHDWWLAIVAAATGRIEFLDEPTVLYRQHPDNAVGLKRLASRGSVARLGSMEENLSRAFRQAEALERHLSHGEVERAHLGIRVAELKRGGLRTLATAIRHGVRKQGFVRCLVFYLLLLKRGFFRGS